MTVAFAAAAVALLLPAHALAAKQWSAPVTISDPSEPVDEPMVAMNGKGAAVAVWYGVDPATAELKTMRAATRAPGEGFAAPTTLGPADTPPGGGPPTLPKVALDRRGDALATWVINDPDGNSRAVASLMPAGGEFGDPVRLSDPGQPAFDPKPGFSRQGRAYVAWSRFDGTSTRVQAASKPASADQFGAPVTISPPGAPADFTQFGVSDSGRAVVAWLSRQTNPPFNHFVDAAIKPPGAGFGPARTLSDTSFDADDPEIGVSPNGDALVAWRQTPGTDLAQLGTAFAADGDEFGVPVVVPSQPDHEPFDPRVAADRFGRFTLQWRDAPQEDSPGTRFVRAARTDPGGEFDGGQTLETTTLDVNELTLAVARAGNAVAGWIESPVGDEPNVFNVTRRARRADAFGSLQALNPAGVPVSGPSVATNRRIAFVVWEVRGTGLGIGLLASKLRPVH